MSKVGTTVVQWVFQMVDSMAAQRAHLLAVRWETHWVRQWAVQSVLSLASLKVEPWALQMADQRAFQSEMR